jgi:hypothetical protein
VHAAFGNPETRGYGDDGLPEVRLYLVGFARSDLWPDSCAGEGHRVYVDVFEHWLGEAK